MTDLLADPERKKLFWSVSANMLTRIPGLVLLFLILPRLFYGLGTRQYAAMFAALALGSLGTFMMGGSSVRGVRLLAAAAAENDLQGEATAFVSLATVNLGLTLALMLGTLVVQLARGEGVLLACVAILPVVQAGLNTVLDNSRMAYNEHYWTALLTLGFQILCYSLALTVMGFATHILLAAAIFHAPVMLASLANGILLLRARPHLLTGQATRWAEILRAGISFGVADGLLTAGLAFAVVWLEAFSRPEIAAWFATQTRLFQMSLSPLLMILLPLAAFARMKWSRASPQRRRDAIGAAVAVGLVGFVGASTGLGLAGPWFARRFLGLPAPADMALLAPMFLFFGTVAFYRCFAAIANVVLDSVALAHRVIAAVVGGLVMLASMPLLGPLASAGTFAAVASALMLVALAGSAFRSLRDTNPVIPPSADDMTTAILDAPIAITNHHRAALTVLSWIGEKSSRYVCARDVHGLMLAQQDADLRDIHRSADLVLPDGMPLVHIARWRGYRSIRRVAGPDFVETMVDLGRDDGVRHYFYGGKPGVAKRMAAALVDRYPGVVVAGASSPPFGEASDAVWREEIAAIMATKPNIVWIGLGTPKQERWMHRFHREMAGATLVGVGAAFDFHAGDVRRAPLWMQRATLEWLHRLLSEPRRLWRRYLVLAPSFVWRVLRDRPQ